MKCSLCGAENPEDKTFCSSCGAYLGGPSDGPESQPAAQQQAPQAQQACAQQPIYQQPAPQAHPQAQQPAYPQQAYRQPPPQACPQQAAPACAQQPYGQAPAYAQPQPVNPSAPYAKPGARKTLTLVAFVFCIVGIATALLNLLSMTLSNPNGALVYAIAAVVILAYKIPMTVHAWGICKGRKRITTAFGVCTLLFEDLVAGILLLVAKKHDRM